VRPIYIAYLDKRRPVLVLTREIVRAGMTSVSIAPITTNVRGLSTEVSVGARNGLHQEGVVSCDNITTIPVSAIGKLVGYLFPDQEPALAAAILMAFDLEP
jgi:mRNA interferase MazF